MKPLTCPGRWREGGHGRGPRGVRGGSPGDALDGPNRGPVGALSQGKTIGDAFFARGCP